MDEIIFMESYWCVRSNYYLIFGELIDELVVFDSSLPVEIDDGGLLFVRFLCF